MNIRKGQHTIEFAILIAVVVAAIVAGGIYIRRSIQAKLKLVELQINEPPEVNATWNKLEPVCGDGVCNGNEQPLNIGNKGPNNCLPDCGIQAWYGCDFCDSFPLAYPHYRPCLTAKEGWCSQIWKCGNGYCEPGETLSSCGRKDYEKDCAPSGGVCFLKGTKITLADGSSKNIEEIKTGDSVLGYKDRKFHPVKVNNIFLRRKAKGYFVIATSDNQSIKVTGEHPVFVGKGYKKVRKLKLTDTLFLRKDNRLQPVKIKSIEFKRELVDVYNLKVEKTHNFFAEGILFHNK